MSAALTLHVGAALLLPGMPTKTPVKVPAQSLVWLEQSGVEGGPTPAPAVSSKPTRAHPRRAAAHTKPASPSMAHDDAGSLAVAPAGNVTDAPALPGLADGAAGGDASGTQAGSGALSSGSPGAGGSASAPGLLALHDPCGGYFPADARADEGQVHIEVRVDADGHAQASALLVESPLGQGFGQAASACARTLRFAPARDAHGAPSQGVAKLALRFRRG